MKFCYLVPVLVGACGGAQHTSNVNFDKLPRVTMTNPGEVMSEPHLERENGLSDKLVAAGIPATEVSNVIKYADGEHWPKGFSTDDLRQQNRDKFKLLHLRKVVVLADGSTLVVAPASENSGLPGEFRPSVDFYINIQTDALATP